LLIYYYSNCDNPINFFTFSVNHASWQLNVLVTSPIANFSHVFPSISIRLHNGVHLQVMTVMFAQNWRQFVFTFVDRLGLTSILFWCFSNFLTEFRAQTSCGLLFVVLRVSKCLEGDDGPTKTSTKVIFVLKLHIYHNYFIHSWDWFLY